MRVVHLVPRLPRAPEGVGSYALELARALRPAGVESRFLAGDSGSAAEMDAAGFPARQVPTREAAALGEALAEESFGGEARAEAVLVHYVNYGYQRRGCPAWLVDGVARWRAGAPARRLVTIFHEVYASGPPWRSSFWLSPVQRRLAARLLRASDGTATSLGLYGRMLRRWGPRRPVVVAPVFSTVGEPATVPASADRLPRTLLVFGGAGNRRRAYGELGEVLAAACRALGAAEIIDLGPPLDAQPARVGGIAVRALGTRPAAEVSAVLLGSYAGFLAYPPPLLAKSTVFAAYCAHGLVPVCSWPRRAAGDAGERPPCWDPRAQAAPPDGAGLAARARAWYAGHDVAHQAASFRALLSGGELGREG